MEQSSSSAVPFSIMGIVKGAYPIVQKNIVNLAIIVGAFPAAIILLYAAITWIFMKIGVIGYTYSMYFGPQMAISGFGIFIYVLLGLATAVAGIFWSLMAYKMVSAFVEGKSLTFEEAFTAVKPLALPYFLTMLLMGVCLAGLAMLLVIPMYIFMIFWIFTPLVVVLEGKKYMDAMKESKRIVQGRWWKTFGYMIAFGILGNIAMIPVWIFARIPYIGVLFIIAGAAALACYMFVVQMLFYHKMKETAGKTPAAPTAPAA